MILRYWIKVKRTWQDYRADIVLGATAFFISFISFSLGYIAAREQNPPQIVISNVLGVSQNGVIPEAGPILNSSSARYVASRNGKYYYLESCPGVQRIKEENKVWFQTRQAAEARGYRPAANCPGLE